MDCRWTRLVEPLSRTAYNCSTRSLQRRVLPCSGWSLSHGSRLLSRVKRLRSVSSPADSASSKLQCKAPPDGSWRPLGNPLGKVKDGEDHGSSIPHPHGNFQFGHLLSSEGGHVKVTYTARSTFLNPETKILEYGRPRRKPLIIMYASNFVEDDEFWNEVCVLCHFATSVAEREKCTDGHPPEKDSRPVEFIYVRGRFHYNSDEPDEPWHITVDFGNRQTWSHGEGFFRRGYHIYAKGDNLANGYAGYCSPVNKTGNLMNIAASPSLGQSGVMPGAPSSLNEKESVLGVPRGVRGYFRNSAFRRTLYETTLREFKPPKALFELVDMDELNDMIKCIREGALKSARPSKEGDMVIDFSGNWVKAHQAISDARKAGKEVPLGWKKIAQHELLRSCAKGRAAGSAYEKTRRTRRDKGRTTRPWQGSPKSRTSEATKEASRPLFKTRGSWDEGLLDFSKDHSECKRSESNVSSRSEEVQRVRVKGRSRRTAGPSQSKKSEAAERAPSLKLTIRDPPNIGTGARQHGSASGTVDSKDSCEQLLTDLPEGKKLEFKGPPRKATRSKKEFDLGRALLDVTHEPTGFVDYKKAAWNRKLASDDRPTGPRLDRLSGSSVGALLLDYTGPASGGRSPRASSSRKGKARPCGLVESDSDTRDSGKQTSRPLPPSDTDTITKNGKKVRNPSKLQGVEQRRALKMTPKWVLPRSTKEGTSDEVHA